MSNQQRYDASFNYGEGKPVIQNETTQRRIHWTLLGLLWLGFSLSYVSVTHCSFVRKGDASKDYRSLDQMGIFKVPYYGDDDELLGCIRYSGNEWDRNFKVVRAVSVFLLFCLSLLAILHTLSVLFLLQERRKTMIHWLGRGLIFPSLVFNSMLFIILGGDECKSEDMQCRPGAGAIMAMLNELVLAGAAMLYLLVPPPVHPVYVRYSELSDLQSEHALAERSVFSIPETIKAKETMKKKVDQSTKSKKNRPPPKDPSTERALVVRDPTAGHHVNHHGSSSTLLMEDLTEDAEAPPSPPRRARTYRAPSRTANV